ncbi:MAG: FkbM family methyltransferase [Rhizobiales bacterium]|jgi:FkbM family methyltransferase|nr:FkbM family methyltransferase [Hyphomicrobiales bacterium]
MLLREIGKAKAKVARAFGLEPKHDTRFAANGERLLLKLVASLPEASAYNAAIDVGANIGDWTGVAMEELSAAGISKYYCVEPIPAYARKIESRFAAIGKVELVERVLSGVSGGTAEIFEIGGGGRMYKNYRGDAQEVPDSSKKIVSHKVAITTGDEVFGAADIKPYLLKIDCDGHDFHVLQGFTQTLRVKRPLVQFEYSDFWIGAGSRLRDACALLADAGYHTYKVFPDRLVRFKFNAMLETFGYQNIFAVPAGFKSLDAKVVEFAAR